MCAKFFLAMSVYVRGSRVSDIFAVKFQTPTGRTYSVVSLQSRGVLCFIGQQIFTSNVKISSSGSSNSFWSVNYCVFVWQRYLSRCQTNSLMRFGCLFYPNIFFPKTCYVHRLIRRFSFRTNLCSTLYSRKIGCMFDFCYNNMSSYNREHLSIAE